MAHSFLKKLDDSTSKGYSLLITLCFCGSFFLINSFISELLFPDKELSILTAMLSSFFFGLPIIYNAIKDVFTGRMEMNELAALSFSASFFTNQYRTASIIALFMIVSHLIEYRSKLKASKNIEELMRLSPETASVLTDGVYVNRSTTSLKKNDTVQVLPGYKIPGDGIVINGYSTVDESAITGESNPVEKRSNSSVYGGTINISGRLVIRITKESSESFISKIKDLIDQAEKSRTPIMRIINKYAVWYTPVVLMLTFILLFITKDINRAISVLIVACPCTVLLSAPTAVVAALSAATRLGILFRNISSLEIIKKVDTVIFDKTGTLTHGCFNIVSVKSVNGMNADQILFYVGSVEQYSTHPLAKSIINYCKKRDIVITHSDDFIETAGMGVSGVVDGKTVYAGRKEWIESVCGIIIDNNYSKNVIGTFIYIVIDKRLSGIIYLADSLKKEVFTTIRSLKQNKVDNIIMLTGDKKEIAGKIADEIGCSFEAELLPHQKMDYIRKAQKNGRTVAMVGDGINDAPALSSCDLSIAMGCSGSDIAIYSASIILMNDNLDRIPFLFKLSHKTIKIMNQNIIFSISFIIFTFILSIFGFLNPVIASILHSFSTVVIIYNSARLLKSGDELA